MFIALFAFATVVLFVVVNQYFEDIATSTHHLACADYSCSIEFYNFPEQESQVPLHNPAQQKAQIPLHNFWSGKE
jgi:hypothetical protein